MFDAAPTQEDLRALEQMRQRLFQITSSIASLKNDVLQTSPLPPWSSLQNSASILASNIQALAAHQSKHSELLNRLVVYPATNYPGRTQEGILTQLLRKKNEPQIETWVDAGRATSTTGGTGGREDEDLTQWAGHWINTRITTYITEEAGDMYTAEERETGIEHVNTGLKRKLEEDSEDEDEDMDGDDIAVISARRTGLGNVEYGIGPLSKDPDGKTRKVDDILRFATSAVIPPEPGRR